MSDSNSSFRLTPLDGLRGLASLMIVILHYRNLNDKWNETIINTNPFWDQLILVYKFGWIGVEFFFVLSGFIFFWKYGEKPLMKWLRLRLIKRETSAETVAPELASEVAAT